LLSKVFFGLPDDTLPEYLDLTPREKFAAGILVIFVVLVGLWPFPFVKVIESGVEPVLLQIVGAG
jgi:NADH:ubiquinone oxidoreductase subunit 4 (subunit M)